MRLANARDSPKEIQINAPQELFVAACATGMIECAAQSARRISSMRCAFRRSTGPAAAALRWWFNGGLRRLERRRLDWRGGLLGRCGHRQTPAGGIEFETTVASVPAH